MNYFWQTVKRVGGGGSVWALQWSVCAGISLCTVEKEHWNSLEYSVSIFIDNRTTSVYESSKLTYANITGGHSLDVLSKWWWTFFVFVWQECVTKIHPETFHEWKYVLTKICISGALKLFHNPWTCCKICAFTSYSRNRSHDVKTPAISFTPNRKGSHTLHLKLCWFAFFLSHALTIKYVYGY